MPIQYGGPGVTPSLGSLVTTQVTLNSGEVWSLPAGRWGFKPGPYTVLQEYDPVSLFWRTIGAGETSGVVDVAFSDGVNYRLANQTQCPVGALITNAGSGYTSAPTVAASAGSSIWRAIVGGAVNTSVTVTNGGTNYTYPPIVLFSAPPGGGIPAAGYSTLTSGAVSAVTVTDQGAGYTSAPTISFINDPREGLNGVTQGYNAAATCTLTGAGTITGLVCIDHGQPATYSNSAALPTLSFTGGGGSSAAATVIMNLSITAYAVSATTAGSGYTAPVLISAYGGFPATAAAYTNPTTQSNLVKTRNAFILGSVSGVAITATGQTVYDGGVYPGFPTTYVASNGLQGAGAVQVVFLNPTCAPIRDVSLIWPT